MESILTWGLPWIIALQDLGTWLTGIMKAFTFLGNEEFYLVVAPILFWCVNTTIGIRMGLVLMLSSSLNSILKLSLAYPRPYWVDERVIAYSSEASFGAPSGHAQNAMAVWGTLAAWLRKPWAWVAAGILIFFIGISRWYLGVHFPTDTLIGWTAGALVLWLVLRLEPPVLRWIKRFPAYQQTLWVLAASLALILCGALVRLSLGDWQFPAAWQQILTLTAPGADLPDPLSLAGLVSNAGAFFGLAAGMIGLRLRGGYQPRGTTLQQLVKYVMGLVGVLLIWRGLGMLLPGEATLAAFAARYLRYALIGLWVTGLAPYLFVRMKLAKQANQD